jgi:HEAT repeat protein
MPFVKRSLAAGTDPQAQQKAAEALSKPGLEAVPAILDALADDQPGAVNNYATVYRQVRTGYSFVAPSNNRFRDAAVQALAKVGPAVVPTLDEALADRSPTVREVAATALGRLGADAKPAVPTLIGLFQDRDPAVRLRAAEAVGQLGPTLPETVPALTGAVAHKDPVVRRAAVTALQRLQPAPPPAPKS